MRISDAASALTAFALAALAARPKPVRFERSRATGPARRVLDNARSQQWWLVVPLLLAACGEAKTDHATLAKYEAQARSSRDQQGLLVCAHGPDGAFARACTVDRATSDDGLILTVRHPDGAFHRLLVTKDGRGVIAADGAEKAKVSVLGTDEIEVALGGDRYRLPATVKGAKPAP